MKSLYTISALKPTFRILQKDKKTRARLGLLKTAHGTIKTPSYVMVATHANIRTLEPKDLKKLGIQVVISNTYHLWDKGLKSKKRRGDVAHKLLGTKLPMMTDSGGFQVFSFGAAREHNVGKVLVRDRRKPGEKSLIKIKEKGVYFTVDGQVRFLSPELSMEIQEKLGADIIFAFDECTSPLHSFKHNKEAMERTFRWAQRCLKAHQRDDQMLFGIVQGGRFNALRKKSAKQISSLPFDGFGIGGSYGKDEMIEKLQIVIPELPDEKPRHLLGIGRVEDIFNAIESGVDLFDCVIPTREGRHGKIWTDDGTYDIRRGKYKTQTRPLEKGCTCFVCKKEIPQSIIHTLFRAKDPLAGRYATLHNITYFNRLVGQIRDAIKQGKFSQFKKSYLKKHLPKKT